MSPRTLFRGGESVIVAQVVSVFEMSRTSQRTVTHRVCECTVVGGFDLVYDKMSRVEAIMDNRLAFLDQVIAATGPR